MAGDIPAEYLKHFSYLEEQSRWGAPTTNNAICEKLTDKSRNLPGLARALQHLSVRYF